MLDNENRQDFLLGLALSKKYRLVSYADGVFGTWDYVLFGIMLSISCLIGVFLAWKGKN